MTDQLTAQEVFDASYKAMVAQGKPSITQVREEGIRRCLYRGPDGLKCAVGALLTDNEAAGLDSYRAHGVNVRALYEDGKLPARLRPHLLLLETLQLAHDQIAFEFAGADKPDAVWLDEFKHSAANIAAERNLTVPE